MFFLVDSSLPDSVLVPLLIVVGVVALLLVLGGVALLIRKKKKAKGVVNPPVEPKNVETVPANVDKNNEVPEVEKTSVVPEEKIADSNPVTNDEATGITGPEQAIDMCGTAIAGAPAVVHEEKPAVSSESPVLSYSEEAASAGAVYGSDGVKGHGGFLLYSIVGGDPKKDYYDYYVSPYGDKRRCLYHQGVDGQSQIVFDEALVDGEFFPSDYYEYFIKEDGSRTRVHMIEGVAGPEEDANFEDPFAASYDIAAYSAPKERRLTHYENGNPIIDQVIADPDIALDREFTYQNGSHLAETRSNRSLAFPKKETTPEAAAEPVVETVNPIKKSYKKRTPFLDKLASSDPKLRGQYAQIKALMLSYSTHERSSIPCDTYSKHRAVYLKAEVYGKHLNLAYRLNPKDYANSTIPTKDVSDKKIYAETPLMIQVRSDLSFRRAKKLIIDMMGPEAGIDEATLERVAAEAEAIPSVVIEKKPVPLIEETPVPEESASPSLVEEAPTKGPLPRVPFDEKLENSDPILKARYGSIKSAMESYGFHSRTSIPCDTYSLHRQDYLKITIDGKTLKAFFHLAPKDYDGTTIPHEDASDKKTYVDTPLLLHVSSDLAARRAVALIDDMMAKAGISKKKAK